MVTQQGGGLLAAQGIPSCFQSTNALPGAPAHIRTKADFRPRACLPLATVWTVECFPRIVHPCDQTVYCSARLLLQCNPKLAGESQVSCSSSHSAIQSSISRSCAQTFATSDQALLDVLLLGSVFSAGSWDSTPPRTATCLQFIDKTWQHKVQQWMRHYLGLVGFDDSTKRRNRCAGDPCAKLAAKSSCSSCIHVAGRLI